MGDATLSKVEERIAMKNTLVVADESIESDVSKAKDESLIPTAIVKPKYQKLSFDERQLPTLWNSTSNNSATITTTPRKVQKHLPKSQKHARKLVSARNSDSCGNYDVLNKEAINRGGEKRKDIDCGVIQIQNINNSVAIVQPIKKVIDTSDFSDVEKEFERSKNSAMSMKAELKSRNSSKINAANEIVSKKQSDDKNNLNSQMNFDKLSVASGVKVGSDKKVPMKSRKEQSGEFIIF